jgi:hypothetical protein
MNTPVKFVTSVAVVALLGACGPDDRILAEDVEGRYELKSSFSMPDGIPEGELTAVNRFMELADHPDLAAAWVLEIVEEELDGAYLTAFQAARKGVGFDELLQETLEERDPEALSKLVDLADDIKQVVTNLQLRSEMELVAVKKTKGGNVNHVLVGSIFTIDGESYDYDFSRMHVSAIPPVNTRFEINHDGWLRFQEQGFSLPYGDILTFAVHEVIAPKIDPTADNLADLITTIVPCGVVGDVVAEAVGFGPGEIYATACQYGLEGPAQELNDEFSGITAQLIMRDGEAIMIDNRGDRLVDRFDDGQWEGDIGFATGTIRLKRPTQTFQAERIGGTRFVD